MSGAKYVSNKPDGYLNIRNNVYRDRQAKQKEMAFELQGACRNLPEQTKENYSLRPLK
jgi:hypothetical protein